MNAPATRGPASALPTGRTARSTGPESERPRPELVYALYGGVLYGTERMALATAQALADRAEVLLIAPPGVVHAEASSRGVAIRGYRGLFGLLATVFSLLRESDGFVFLATRLEQSLALCAANVLLRRPVTHRLVVHGGGGKNVYRRNRLIQRLPLRFIAVSDYVRDCLVENGIDATRIDVAPNFLTDDLVRRIPRRGPFMADGVRSVALVVRTEPVKRVDLLLDALDLEPRLAGMAFHVYGDGSDLEPLRARARRHPGAVFHGFVADAVQHLAAHDLLLHTAPREPFGLVVLEAMAAGLPVLVPDSGGPASIVEPGVGGWCYAAEDAAALAQALLRLRTLPATRLQAASDAARHRLGAQFSQSVGQAVYLDLMSKHAKRV
jgi:glycosyltransferase involved in cell wall biosynthesis